MSQYHFGVQMQHSNAEMILEGLELGAKGWAMGGWGMCVASARFTASRGFCLPAGSVSTPGSTCIKKDVCPWPPIWPPEYPSWHMNPPSLPKLPARPHRVSPVPTSIVSCAAASLLCS